MPSPSIFLTLYQKKQLTHDVYELEYRSEYPLPIIPGQFLLCDTTGDRTLRRSYSVSWAEEKSIFFIIKRLSQGKWWSRAICDQHIGHCMEVWGPLGGFVVQKTNFPKVFIGTGTGFAPLYFQMRSLLQNHTKVPLFFLFGVREIRDVLLWEELKKWSEDHSFGYEIYCSQEKDILTDKHHAWRVTHFITPTTIDELNPDNTTAFYICGSPVMVSEVRSLLEKYGVKKEKIFFEQC